jgi:hypothetical protein
VREAEANIELLRIVSAATAADWDVKFTIKRVHPVYFASRGTPEIPAQFRHPASEPLFGGFSLRFPKVVGRDQFGILHARHAVTR